MFAQGTILFNNRNSLGTSHVYSPPSDFREVNPKIGNGPNDGPSGTTDWTGYTPIGTSGLTGQYGAATTFAQLLAANGANQPESSLTPQGAIITFRTGAGAGLTQGGINATLANVPKDSPAATLEVVAWDNSSGLYSTWELAYAAWLQELIPAGWSGTFNQFAVGGDLNFPPNTVFPSFTLFYNGPEPSTLSLGGLGAAVLWIMRRRK